MTRTSRTEALASLLLIVNEFKSTAYSLVRGYAESPKSVDDVARVFNEMVESLMDTTTEETFTERGFLQVVLYENANGWNGRLQVTAASCPRTR